jgi:thiamine-phosphate pyrophosphorylase
MDLKLRDWGLRRRADLPRLWLFTDARRLPDPLPAAARLPRGRAGIVFRHDDAPDRAAIGRALARICRERRLVLVVAGDPRLAASLGAGIHLRGGRRALVRPNGVITSSAHNVTELIRARRAGAGLTFLSPAFRTESHPGAPGMDPPRWGLIVRRASAGQKIAALGGVNGCNIRRLPSRCIAAGAIGALA